MYILHVTFHFNNYIIICIIIYFSSYQTFHGYHLLVSSIQSFVFFLTMVRRILCELPCRSQPFLHHHVATLVYFMYWPKFLWVWSKFCKKSFLTRCLVFVVRQIIPITFWHQNLLFLHENSIFSKNNVQNWNLRKKLRRVTKFQQEIQNLKFIMTLFNINNKKSITC